MALIRNSRSKVEILDRVEARVHRDAGIGDQHIDAAEGLDGAFDKPTAVIFFGHVGRHADRFAAELQAFVTHTVERVRPSRRQRQSRPLLHQLPRQFGPMLSLAPVMTTTRCSNSSDAAWIIRNAESEA